MKRGIAIITFIILLSFCVTAVPSVTLTSPSNGATETSSTVSFTCSASDAGTLTSLGLYTDTGGSWTQVTSNTTSGTTMYLTHEISSISDGSYNWNCKATNDLAETSFYTSNYTLTVSAASVTFTGTIANQTITEDTTSSNAFDLDTYFTGASSYAVTGNSEINVTIAGDNQVSFIPDANFSGSETIRFSGTNGDTAYSNYIILNVTAINDKPHQTSNMTDQSLTKNTNTTLTLSSYFSDVDGDTLNYSASSTSNIDINISGATATIVPNTDWTGNETVSFSATDGTLSVTANTITIEVTGGATNNAPTVDTYSPDSDPTLDPGDSQDFSVTYSDSDNDSLTVTWYLDGSQTTTGDSYTFTTETSGTYTVRADVSDGTDTTAKSWSVTVTGSSFEEVDENVDVDSILGEQTSSADCGNGIAEDGETCLNCALDVKCEKGEICQGGVCVAKSSSKTLIIFLIILVVLIGGSIAGYYFFMVKKTPPPPQQKQGFRYQPGGIRPPTDYTDFYKKK
jgi:large repetitive protein